MLERETGEKLVGRTGGAVTLAVGMAKVFASVPGMRTVMSYWYHFVIMFEALFILTLLETGTRVARFVFQETVGQFTNRRSAGGSAAGRGATPGGIVRRPNWGLNIFMSILTCFCWGFLLYLGDLKTLWSMLGIANQLLASIALAIGTTYLLNHAAKRSYALCTALPFVFVLITTVTAAIGKICEWWAQIPNLPADQAFLLRLASLLAAIMLVLTGIIAVDAIRRWVGILRSGAVGRLAQVAAAPGGTASP
jgi:carbon starvation protein